MGNTVLVPQAYGTLGTTARNIFRDQGFKNLDMSVTKAFKFRERLSAEFKAEIFNAFNHPTFANPYGGPGGPLLILRAAQAMVLPVTRPTC